MNKKKLFSLILPIGLLIACVGLIVYYICCPMEGYLHSDYTDTIYWANASLESGAVFDPEFEYAGLLPFSANLWFMPLIAIFGVSMTAQRIGMILFLLLFVAAVWFMCRSLGWSVRATALTSCAMLMILSGSDKLREMMWGHVIYYSLAVLLLCVAVGLAARLSRLEGRPGKKEIPLIVATAVLFIGTATDGFQMIALVILPIIAATVLDIFLDPHKKLLDKSNNASVLTVLGMVAATAVGYLLLMLMKGNIRANYASVYSALSPASKWAENLIKLPGHWFSLLGVAHGEQLNILSAEGIKAVLFTLLGVLLIAVPVIALCNYRGIEDKETRSLLLVHFSVSAVVIFGYVCGTLGDSNWRMLPMLATAIISTVASLRYYVGRAHGGSYLPKRVTSAVLAAITVCSLVNFGIIAAMPTDHGRDNDLHRLTRVLEEKELSRGYATFWNSQAITLLSDSRVKTMMVLVDENLGITTDYYQNSKKWYEDAEDTDRYFLLLNLAENAAAEKCDEWLEFADRHTVEKLYLMDRYVLYILDANIELAFPE